MAGNSFRARHLSRFAIVPPSFPSAYARDRTHGMHEHACTHVNSLAHATCTCRMRSRKVLCVTKVRAHARAHNARARARAHSRAPAGTNSAARTYVAFVPCCPAVRESSRCRIDTTNDEIRSSCTILPAQTRCMLRAEREWNLWMNASYMRRHSRSDVRASQHAQAQARAHAHPCTRA
eukprot:4464983-Pleurochrysis_carterae.AAC.1